MAPFFSALLVIAALSYAAAALIASGAKGQARRDCRRHAGAASPRRRNLNDLLRKVKGEPLETSGSHCPL